MTKNTTVSEIGEFGLIARIQQILPPATHPDLILGIGDDTAVIRQDDQRVILITCDIQIQNQHFRLKHTPPYQLGRRAMAVNLSDIAAMGGQPTFALVSLGLPKSFPGGDFDALFQGLRDELAQFSALIIGGNLSHSEKDLIIDITLMGEACAGQFITRSGARPGDRIFVTGEPGAAGAGLILLEKFGTAFPAEFTRLVEKHRRPIPRIEAGQRIAQSGQATAMIDVSDGLAGDLSHLCTMSQVGAEICENQLPLAQDIQAVATLAGKPALEIVLHSGEDYELLFTLKADTPEAMLRSMAHETGVTLTEIGKIIPESGFFIRSANQRTPLSPTGWDHFRQRYAAE
jgi:thiamine-monophosphate kinase